MNGTSSSGARWVILIRYGNKTCRVYGFFGANDAVRDGSCRLHWLHDGAGRVETGNGTVEVHLAIVSRIPFNDVYGRSFREDVRVVFRIRNERVHFSGVHVHENRRSPLESGRVCPLLYGVIESTLRPCVYGQCYRFAVANRTSSSL